MSKMKKTILGVFAGITAGAVAGVLFAPAKGFITRRRLQRKSREVAVDAKAAMEDTSETIQDEIAAMKKESENLFANGAKKVISVLRSKKF